MNLRTILILGALSAFGPLAIDFYLPGFPAMAQAFATDETQIQLTLAVYFLGLSIGQLAYGPVADRFGRRVPLLVGVGLFTVASLACAFAPTLEWLIGARFVQALGGCAGMVLSRAIVSDKCDAVQSAKVFSQLMLVMGLAPILAPMLGGLLVNLYGWQSIFLVLTVFKRGPAFLLARMVWVYLAAGLVLLGVSTLHTAQLWPLLIPLFICIASLGCIIPNASACAMSGQGARAGSASAMLGCLQFSVAAGAASLVGVLHDGSAMPMAIVITLCGVLAVGLAMATRRLYTARIAAQQSI